MAKILFNEATKEFHLQNDRISYIFCIMENGQLGHQYFGKHLTQGFIPAFHPDAYTEPHSVCV